MRRYKIRVPRRGGGHRHIGVYGPDSADFPALIREFLGVDSEYDIRYLQIDSDGFLKWLTKKPEWAMLKRLSAEWISVLSTDYSFWS